MKQLLIVNTFWKIVSRFRPRRVPVHPTVAVEPLEARIAPATLIWDGSAADGDWFNPENWNQNAVPGVADTAILDISSTINLTTNVDVGSFQQRAGTLTGAGALRSLGTLLWAGGTMSGTGATHADGGLMINGSTVILGRTLNLPQGEVATLSGPNSTVGFQNGAAFNNAGTFLAQNDNSFFLSSGTSLVFNNTGVFSRETTSGDFNIGIPFANSGVVNVATGILSFTGDDGTAPTTGDFTVASGAILQFRSDFDLAPGADITGAGSVDFRSGTVTTGGTLGIQALLVSGGTATLNAASNATTMSVSSGTLNGSGVVTVSGLITWSGGAMSGTGATHADGGLMINGSTVILGRTLNLAQGAVATLSGPNSTVGFQNGAAFNNAGTFLAQNDNSFFLSSGTSLVFNNTGVFSRETTSGDFNIGIPFANSGVVNVATGILSFTGDDGTAPTTGDFTVASGAILQFRSDFDLAPGADITGAGSVDFRSGTVTTGGTLGIQALLVSGGTATLNAASNATTMSISSGTLNGSGVVTVSGLITWSGGAMSGTGATHADGGLMINGSTVILGRSLNLAQGAVATLSGPNSTVGFQNGAAFNNAGTFLAQNDNSFFLSGGTSLVFNNTGVFSRETTSGDFNIGIPFANSGVVNVATGILSFTGDDGTAPTTGDFTVASGAILQFRSDFDLAPGADITGAGSVDFRSGTVTTGGAIGIQALLVSGGTATLNAASNPTTMSISSGTLNGSGLVTVSGLITWSGGAMSGTGATHADGGLMINGSTVILGRSLNLAQGAVAMLSGPNSTVGFQNGAAFNNAGTFLAQNDNSFFLSGGSSLVFNNTGVFSRETTSGDFNIGIPFANSGVVNVATGILSFTGDDGTAPTTGDFTVASGAILQFRSDFDLAPGADITGEGSVDFRSGTVTTGGAIGIQALLVSGGTATLNAASNPTTMSISSGTLNGSGVVTVSGLITWNGGTMSGTGTTTAAGGLLLNGAVVVLSARTFVVPQGQTATLTGNNSGLGLQDGAQFKNAGTFLAQNDISSDLFYSGGISPLFDNSGTFTRDTTPGDFTVTVPFANSGIVNVADGRLTFTGGDGPTATTGDFTVFGGAILDISSQFDFAAGSDISGDGTVEFSRDTVTVAGGFAVPTVLATGATVDFNAPTTGLQSLSISTGTVRFNTSDSINLASLTVTGGTLGGTNTLNVAGLMTWSGGIMDGSGVTNANGGLHIDAVDVILSGRTLNLAAGQTTTLNSGNGFGMQNGARVNNAGTFLVQTDILNDFFSGGGLPSLFTNSGTLVFDTPTTNDFEILFPVANSGVIDLRTGGMRLTNGYTQPATGRIVGDKPITFSGGIVAAAGTIEGNVFNNGAVLSPGELGVGTLGITGDFAQVPGAILLIELGGLGAGQFDQLNISGTATLNNTLNLALVPGFLPPDGTQFPILTYGARTGTFGNATGVADFTIDYQPTAVVLTSISTTTDFVWDAGGGLDTSWFNSANWGPDGVPGPDDTATLNSNAIITLPTAAIVSRFTQIDGTFTGPGLLTTLDFAWFGGTQAGAGITAVPIGGSFSIEGDSVKTVSERTLRLSGTGTWTDAGDVEMSEGARIINAGFFEIQNDARIEFVGVGATPLLLNSGIVRKTIGTGSTTLAGIDFENAGQLRLDSGTLLIEDASATFTQSRGATFLTGGSFSAPGAVVTYTGGLLSGSGTIAASVINSGAKVHPGGSKSGGTLAITGDYTQSGTARLIIELAGKAAGAQHDRFSVGGIVTLGGTLEVNAIGGLVLRNQTSFDVVSYGSFSGALPRLDAPAGVNPTAGAATLTLNARAPAPGPRLITITDADGDIVTARVTKGSIPLGAIVTGANGEFQKLDLRSVESKLNGAKLIINVDQTGSGDGAVNIGAIDATGMDLAKVKLTGDLGQIDIGTGATGKTALKSLVVGSLGALGAATQPGDTDDPLLSEITGALGKLTVTRDVQNAVVEVTGKLGKVTIGGNLIDNRPSTSLAARPGSIDVFLNGGIPPVGSSEGGSIFAPTIDSVTVMGDIDGGEISAETQIKKVKVVGRLTSEDPLDPAILRVGSEVSKVVVTGDVKNALILAGYNRALEPVNPDAKIGKVVVKGNWIGTSVVAGISDPGDNGFGIADALISGDTTPDRLAKIASVIIQGTAMGSTTLSDNSGITAQAIGKLRISDADIALTDSLDNISLDPLNLNFRAVEI